MFHVSVIIPNYNHADFLKQRLDSVLGQSYRFFEVIILDDCSTDSSRDIIESYRQHPKISRIVYNSKNEGTFSQWKKGIDLAKFEHIWIAESDDYSDKDFLKVMMDRFADDDDIVLSYCRSRIVNEYGDDLGLHMWMDQLNEEKWMSGYVEEGQKEVRDYLKFRNTICNASSVVFRKNATVSDAIPVNMQYCGDWLFWKKFLAQPGKIAYTHLPLNFFRDHRHSSRTVGNGKQETKRFTEYQSLMRPTNRFFFESRYDWVLKEWFKRRHLLTDGPHCLIWTLRIRYVFLSVIWKVESWLISYARMLLKERMLPRSY